MSDVHVWFGADGVKSQLSRFDATGRLCVESVVTLSRREWRTRMPWSRISRSTRGLEAAPPRPHNSLTILELP